MNEKFESQKEQLVSIKHEISLLYQQVNYLLRNEKALELLDLDVLMNRTHTLYDMLCSINVGDESIEDDFDLNPDVLTGLFGSMGQEEEDTAPEPEPEKQEEPIEVPEEEGTLIEPQEETPMEPEAEEANTDIPQIVDNEIEKVEEEKEEEPSSDEFGFFFRFEDIPETLADESHDKDETVEKDGKVIHIMEEVPEEQIPERDRVSGDDIVPDDPYKMPEMEKESPVREMVEPEASSSEGLSSYFGDDDAGFELSTSETLGEKMMHEDHSLAAKLQQNPVRDLKAVIGINDKFLFVNELFGGSMEKYNKSIENLNDLKTLNGAMIYLNELKIELQWNSSNEAYQKLKELVSRKFE